MSRRKIEESNIRKLTRIGNKSIGLTLPVEMVRALKWREKQRVVVKKRGKPTGKTRAEIIADQVAARQRVCKYCGKDYIKTKGAGHKDGESYCSRECAFKDHKAWLVAGGAWGEHCEIPKYTLVRQKECTECGLIHYGKEATLAICSEPCKILRVDRLRKEGLQRITHHCPTCGISYCRINGERFRDCPDCADAKAKKYKRARGENHRRRARFYGVRYEPFKVIDIFERDEWRCKACGCDTPKELRGTQHDDAPELDHVIALADGGEHTRANTQCLCRLCNSMKGVMSMDSYMISIGKTPTI